MPEEKLDTNTIPAADVNADALTKAAADAVAEEVETPVGETPPEETPPETEAAETPVETPTEPELDAEGFPKDHKERSELGRKLSALHRRQDEFADNMAKIAQFVEKIAQSKTDSTKAIDLPEVDPDEPITYKEAIQLFEHREQQKVEAKTNYDRGYTATLQEVFSEYTNENGEPNVTEIDGILNEMKTINYKPTSDPRYDAITNLRKAERAFLKKQMAKPAARINPLKGETPRTALGVVPKGKPSPASAASAVKLDPDAERYIKFVAAQDGPERAEKLRQSMGRE